jgi:hypothetical protein
LPQVTDDKRTSCTAVLQALTAASDDAHVRVDSWHDSVLSLLREHRAQEGLSMQRINAEFERLEKIIVGVVAAQEKTIHSLRNSLGSAAGSRSAVTSEALVEMKEQFRELLRQQHHREHSRLIELERQTKDKISRVYSRLEAIESAAKKVADGVSAAAVQWLARVLSRVVTSSCCRCARCAVPGLDSSAVGVERCEHGGGGALRRVASAGAYAVVWLLSSLSRQRRVALLCVFVPCLMRCVVTDDRVHMFTVFLCVTLVSAFDPRLCNRVCRSLWRRRRCWAATRWTPLQRCLRSSATWACSTRWVRGRRCAASRAGSSHRRRPCRRHGPSRSCVSM